MSTLWRLCSWGGGATLALAAVVLTTHTQGGSERLQLALAGTPETNQPRLVVDNNPPNRDAEIRKLAQDVETRRLADAVRTLTVDRDRLVARVATLERSLDDMTGSIKAQTQAAAQTSANKEAPKDTTIASTSMASAPATIAVRIETAKSTAQQSETAEQIPLPPVRTATIAATDTTAAIAPAKPEFGIELAGGPSIEAVRAQWAMIKANYGPALLGLQPSTVMRNSRTGTPGYRLLAGPFPTVGAATQACARLVAARVACRPAKFEGQKLSQQ